MIIPSSSLEMTPLQLQHTVKQKPLPPELIEKICTYALPTSPAELAIARDDFQMRQFINTLSPIELEKIGAPKDMNDPISSATIASIKSKALNPDKSLTPFAQHVIAGSPYSTARELDSLSKSEHKYVRDAVWANPNTSKSTLDNLKSYNPTSLMATRYGAAIGATIGASVGVSAGSCSNKLILELMSKHNKDPLRIAAGIFASISLYLVATIIGTAVGAFSAAQMSSSSDSRGTYSDKLISGAQIGAITTVASLAIGILSNIGIATGIGSIGGALGGAIHERHFNQEDLLAQNRFNAKIDSIIDPDNNPSLFVHVQLLLLAIPDLLIARDPNTPIESLTTLYTNTEEPLVKATIARNKTMQFSMRSLPVC